MGRRGHLFWCPNHEIAQQYVTFAWHFSQRAPPSAWIWTTLWCFRVSNSKIEQHYGTLGLGGKFDFRTLVQNGGHFGIPFFALAAPWVPLGGSVSHKMRFGGGPKMDPKNNQKRSSKWSHFELHFGAIFGTEAWRGRFWKSAFGMRNNLVFAGGGSQIPSLFSFIFDSIFDTFSRWKREEKGGQNGTQNCKKSHLEDFWTHRGGPMVRKRGSQKGVKIWTLKKSFVLSPTGLRKQIWEGSVAEAGCPGR